jgi:hypothetical protein
MVRRLVLDPTGDANTEIEVLEADHPALEGPTTGVIVDGDLYYVANPGFDQVIDGELPPLGELEESVILRLPLPD